MKLKRILSAVIAFAISATALTSCGSTSHPDLYAYDEEAPSLYEAFSEWFKVGTAMNTSDLVEGSEEMEILIKQYNVFTLENESKPENIHPSEDVYNFEALDKLVEFANEYDKTVRGHVLVWHSQCPDWFSYDDDGNTVSADVLIERMKEHITTIVSHYKGEVDVWDVVNEVLGDNGGLRDSMWYQIIGDYDGDGDKYDYIEIAFETAHEADPDARLIINDYSLESSEDKTITMYMMVKSMLEEGIPIDGIGLQMHIDIDFDAETCKNNVEILMRLKEIDPDFVIEITELDLSCYSWSDSSTDIELTDEFVEKFDSLYSDIFEMFIEFSEAGYLDSVVMWGYNDGMSWLNGYPVSGRVNYPLLIDRDYKLKSAYWSLIDLAASKS
ncbi:MAG: endo-1,4-beta-xylanase [Oscillospiraceae bacterium]|nr:endo-1,4-beta-xylanase [Oscillospiraceae bacterium]